MILATLAACGNAATPVNDTASDAATDSGTDAATDALTDAASDIHSDTAADTSGDLTGDTVAVRTCNGMAELCDRPLNDVAFVTTHNSMSNVTDEFQMPNQHGNVTKQLQDGVRAFMLDIHYDNREDPPVGNEVYLCHGVCIFGMRALADTLGEIRDFLTDNPDNVVAIIFESYVSAEHAKVSFDLAGMTNAMILLEPGAEMPTLAGLIDSGRRLLVLTDEDGGGFPGYLPVWDWAWDNDWDNHSLGDLNCDVNRGSGDNAFFILNHFVTEPTATEEWAAQANANPFFSDHATACMDARHHRPNFVTVDFYDIGDTFAVVDELNRRETAD